MAQMLLALTITTSFLIITANENTIMNKINRIIHTGKTTRS